MEISDRKLENEPAFTLHPTAIVKRPALAPAIALCIAIWGDIEARLDSIFLLISKSEEALAEFVATKGWPRKEKLFYRWIKDNGDQEFATAVRAVLRTVAEPAKKRNCLAHGVWGESDQYPDDLIIIPEAFYVEAAREMLRAEDEGTAKLRINSEPMFESARLVGIGELQTLHDDLVAARDLIHRFMIEQTPELVKVHGRSELAKTQDDPKVAARIAQSKANRDRSEGK